MVVEGSASPRAGHGIVRIDAAGRPFIEGFRCPECGAAFVEQTMACRACACRTPPAPYRSGQGGRLWSWSVVHRSYPGIKVPFVSAIVDLDGGLAVKGTVVDVSSENLRQGLPLKLVFDDAGGVVDKEGHPYIGFHFVPEGGES